MAKNTVKIDITGDSSNIIQETKKAQGSIRQFGNECKKTSGQVKTISGELRQEKRVVNELSYQYRNLTAEEKKAFGPQINKEIDARISKIRQLKAEQDKLNMRITGPAAGAMNPLANMQGALSTMTAQMGLPIGNIGTMLSSLVNPATAAAAAIAGVGVAIYKIGKAGEEFKSTMNDMKVRLGLNEKQVKMYGDAALELGNKFGKSGSEIVKQFQYIAQQATGMEKNKQGMLALAEAANKLSIGMGESVETATNTMLTVFSKFDLAIEDTDKLMNTLAAACQNTGANMEYMGTVFDKVGTSAMTAGVDFQEVAAATAILSSVEGDASKVGAELQAMFTKLAKAEDKFNPEKVGLIQAIENMKNANLSNAEVIELVGKRGADGAQVMMRQLDALKQMDQKVRNVAVAEEMFGVKNAELGAAINRIKAAWENFLVTLAENQVFQQLIDYIGKMIDNIAKFITFIGKLADSWSEVGEGVNIFNALTLQMEVTIKVAKAVMTVYNDVAHVIVAVLGKAVEWLIGLWQQFKREVGDTDFVRAITWAFNEAVRIIKGAINEIIGMWNDLKKELGVGGQSKPVGGNEPPKESLSDLSDAELKKRGYKREGYRNKEGNWEERITKLEQKTSGGGGSGSGSKGGKGGGGKTTPKVEIIEGSLEWYDNEIKKINDALKKQNLTYEQIEEKARELAVLERDRKKIVDEQEKAKKLQGFGIHDNSKSKVKPEDLQPKKLTDVFIEPKIKDIEPPPTLFDKLRTMYDNAINEVSKIQHDFDIGLIDEDKARQEIATLQQILDEAGLKVDLKLEVKQNTLAKALNTASDAVGSLGNALSSLGSAMESPELNVAGIIAGAIANIAAGAAQATVAASQTGNPWVWLAFGVAAMAEMVSMIASIHSATGMAEGGIVGGPTTIGDQIYTRLNAGEAVLNQRQQYHLFKALDEGITSDNSAVPTSNTVTIKGDDMYIQMHNYYKRTKKNPFK